MSSRTQFIRNKLLFVALALVTAQWGLAEETRTIDQLTEEGLRASKIYFEETSFADLAAPLTGQRFPRPVPMGSSISSTPTLPFISAGTAGLRVSSLFNPDVKFILSNNHVMGAVGPTLCPNTAPAGTWILQPGTLDIQLDPGQSPFYVVGVLARTIPIDFSLLATNLVDASIALTNTQLASEEIFDVGIPTAQLAFPSPGMEVIKSGRTTDVTTGVVDAVNVTVLVNYGADCGTARFVGQTIITPGTFSDSGDSGSVILDQETNAPVALLFAGGPFSTIASPIHFVYLLFGVAPDGTAPDSSFSAEELLERSRRALPPRIRALAQIQARREADVMRLRGVHGMGIGRVPGEKELGFVIYTKRLSSQLRQLVQDRIEGVPVHIVETEEFVAYKALK
ncbi:MAG TPA: hypothetical protein VKZ59_04545 [Acidobacteriota bacterium]|nr:hypothetical protein [Acidobacteriota bacterium]